VRLEADRQHMQGKKALVVGGTSGIGSALAMVRAASSSTVIRLILRTLSERMLYGFLTKCSGWRPVE
jgi:NAD(P)-dependent dehydrogenase (short-subunit alcohol dehydrogenase family)